MQTYKLAAKSREKTGKISKNLLREGKIPAVVYGAKVKSRAIVVDQVPFLKLYRQAGESTLIDLMVDQDAPVKVLIKDMQLHPVKDVIQHIDFRQVDMQEKITTDIVFNFVGEAPAVKSLNGTLVKQADHVSVECLPADLVPEIEVDVSGLETFDDIIRFKDLVLPKGLTVLSEPEDVVAMVIPPRTEAEMKELEAEVDVSVEGVEKVEIEEGEKEGEEAKEGAEEEKEGGTEEPKKEPASA